MDAYLQTLKDIDKGNLAGELSEKLADLIGLVKERGKAGSIALTLKIKPIDEDGESVTVIAGVKVTEPAKVERASIFFTTTDNQLVRDNPAQTELPLVAMEKPADVQPISKTN